MKQQNIYYQGNRYVLFIRCALFQLWFVGSAVLLCPVLIISMLFPLKFRLKVSQIWVLTNLWAIDKFCGINFKVQGVENIPISENMIVLSKHQSAWETLALQKFFPESVFLLKRELLWLPIWGWAMATLKPIAINRATQKKALRSLIKQGSERLKEGVNIIIFPEGTRIAPGKKTKFNVGGCLLAEQSGYPVIPVAHNAGEYWPRYSFYKYPGTIEVRIGPIMESKGKKARELNEEVQQWIENTMSEISELER